MRIVRGRIPSWIVAAIAVTLQSMVTAAVLLAQDNTAPSSTVRTTTTENYWYGQPWVWVVGIAVFLIVIIALTNRGRRV